MRCRKRFSAPEQILMLICVGLVFLVSISLNLYAQWSNDPTVNTPICTAERSQSSPEIICDDDGGAFIIWEDIRNLPSTYTDIYAQHIDSLGFVKWTINGAGICTASNYQRNPAIVNDGYGGAIVVWYDYRNNENKIYAQRISAAGTIKWTANGIAIGLGGSGIKVINDGFGGFIISWFDNRSGNDDIYAQKIDSSGAIHWISDGVPICSAVDNQWDPDLIPDGEGGAIIAWEDYRNGLGNDDIYAQRIDSSGSVLWTADGRAICAAAGRQYGTKIISDNVTGAILVWTDERSGTFQNDLYAQRVSSSGTIMWATNGVPVCTESGTQWQHSIVSDGVGGVLVTWEDQRGINDIYAQRLSENGIPLWQLNGIEVCTANWIQEAPTICADGEGGAIIGWADDRDHADDLYAQRVNSSGVVEWPANGIPISTASGGQRTPKIAGITSKGAIITWMDERNGFTNSDIFAQWVNAQGQLTSIKTTNFQGMPKEITLAQNYPNPFNPRTVIEYSVPRKEQVEIIVFNMLGHSIKTLVSGEHAPGKYIAVWDATSDSGSRVSSGVYFYQITAGNYNAIKKMVLLK